MAQVTFTGTVSAQVAPRSVVITVTKPAGGTATVSTTTTSSRTFSVVYTDVAGTGYKAVAVCAADAQYDVATSLQVTFNITKDPSTITLSVA
jgi:hypothetical protein